MNREMKTLGFGILGHILLLCSELLHRLRIEGEPSVMTRIPLQIMNRALSNPTLSGLRLR
jgi:hypothetical protein